MIDPTAPAYPYEHKFGDGTATRSTGIPIRLEIASRIMVAMAPRMDSEWDEDAKASLHAADALLEVYNDSQS